MKYKKILIASTILLLLVLLVLWLGGNMVEDKITKYVARDHSHLVNDLDYMLWKNTLEITLNDTSFILAAEEKKFSWTEGNIQLKGFSFWHYWMKGTLSFDRLSWHSTSLKVTPSSSGTMEEGSVALAIVLDKFEFNTKALFIRHAQHQLSGKRVLLEMGNITIDSTRANYTFEGSAIDSLSIETAKKIRYDIAQVRTEEKVLKLTQFSMEDKEYSHHKRLYINGKVEAITATWAEDLSLDDNITWNEIKMTGMHMSLDENGDKPICNGMRPCKKKLLSQVLVDLPIHQKIEASGSLIYRFFQSEKVVSLLDMDHIYLLGKWDKPLKDRAARQFNFSVKTNLNDQIDTHWSGAFYSDERFHYNITADPFPMTAINKMIPPQKGYSIAASTGNCSRLKMDVEGRALASKAAMILDYTDLTLDIKKDRKLGTRFLDFASKSFINNNHESVEPLLHETTFSQERSFFYQMGQHINHGFKHIIVEDWAEPLL